MTCALLNGRSYLGKGVSLILISPRSMKIAQDCTISRRETYEKRQCDFFFKLGNVHLVLQQSSYDGDFSRELERVGARMTPDDDCVVPNLRRVPSLSDLSEEGSLGMYTCLLYCPFKAGIRL